MRPFQSTPGIAAGRIPALPGGGHGCQRFNPRPALLPGESPQTGHIGDPLVVSIHARHCCRANRGVDLAGARASMFQSTPGIAAGRILTQSQRLPPSCSFNPRPALLPGESLLRRMGTQLSKSFNPRPALLPGESGDVAAVAEGLAVSIHARHCCRANPQLPGVNRDRHIVSIHARHCCRANPGLPRWAACQDGVSIHARHCCRANPPPSRTLPRANKFQSTPGIAAGRIMV